MPQAADGMRIDPPVSVPSAPKHMPVARRGGGAAARSPGRSRGVERIAHGPKADSSLVVPNANSWRFVLPMMIAPAALSLRDGGRVRRRRNRRLCRAGRRLHAGDVDQVLHRDRNAVERAAVTPGANLLRRAFGVRERLGVEPGDEGVELGPGVDRGETRLHERHGRERAGLNQGRDVDDLAKIRAHEVAAGSPAFGCRPAAPTPRAARRLHAGPPSIAPATRGAASTPEGHGARRRRTPPPARRQAMQTSEAHRRAHVDGERIEAVLDRFAELVPAELDRDLESDRA